MLKQRKEKVELIAVAREVSRGDSHTPAATKKALRRGDLYWLELRKGKGELIAVAREVSRWDSHTPAAIKRARGRGDLYWLKSRKGPWLMVTSAAEGPWFGVRCCGETSTSTAQR